MCKGQGRAHRAPMAPLSAVSRDTMLGTPTFGVATGTLPPAFWRFVSAMFRERYCARSCRSGWLSALSVRGVQKLDQERIWQR